MSKLKIRIELERPNLESEYHGRTYNYEEVYVQIVNLAIPESLIISISNRVNEFLQREIELAERQVL